MSEGKPLSALPGYKRVPVTLIIHTYEDVPENWTDEDARFFVEENHCLGNYITREAEDIEAKPDECNLCFRAKALLGHVGVTP